MITPAFGLTATERVLPKLALDFTTASLDSRVTFTRTTGASNPATFVNGSGVITAATNDQPRFDYDPVTLVCKGLLIEESRTNQFLYSNGFDQVLTWVPTNTTAATAAVAVPDGTTNGFTLTGNGVSGQHNIAQTYSTSSQVTMTVYAKKNTHNFIQLLTNLSTSGFVNFNLDAGTVSATTATGSITDVGNGWYRCTAVFVAAAITSARVGLVSSLASVRGETNSISNGVYLFGAQLETGAFATSYIPTTTTALTRNADVATMTGTNFSDWFNASEGTLLGFGATGTGSAGAPTFLSLDDGTTNNRFILRRRLNDTQVNLRVVSASGSIDNSNTTGTPGAVHKIAGAYKTNDQMVASDTVLMTGIVSLATLPTCTQLQLGVGPGSTYWNGHIQEVMYWPQRLTNAELQAFTK